MKNIVFVSLLSFPLISSVYGQENVPVNDGRVYYYTIDSAALIANDQLLDSLYQARSIGRYAIAGEIMQVSQTDQDNERYTSYKLRIGGDKYIYARTLRPNLETVTGDRVVLYGALVKTGKPRADADQAVIKGYSFACEKMEDLTSGKKFRFRMSIPEAPNSHDLFPEVSQTE